ncbi:hypothetical protein CNBG_1664 [Cryptococcus deuterogattii R265]|uniref:uncharacterized protein n=1 Tax=Cryptococcus deuterogattii (strain R265) TaxID=294750 RepID=UPI0019360FBA|nr:hypothetical protein CNBG_1664 [Cryptococcus deuterogattii R265]
MAPRRQPQASQRKGKQPAQETQDDSDEETQSGRSGSLTRGFIESRAGMLVRLALFQEYKRIPIRRTEIAKQILPDNIRAFPLVFACAQTILRNVFGCELYEIRARGKEESTEDPSQTQTMTQTQKKGKGKEKQSNRRMDAVEGEEEDEDEDEEEEEDATATQRVKRETGTKVYILQNILPGKVIEAMAEPAPLPYGIQAEGDDDDSGALLQWDKGDGGIIGHVGLLGIRTLILSLVLCHNRIISDDHLHALLRRVNLYRETVLPYASKDTSDPFLTLDKYLDLLAKYQYLEKIKNPGPMGQPEGGTIEWRWGSREAEFSSIAAAKFMEEIMLGKEGESDSEEEEEDEEDQPRRRGREAPRERSSRTAKRQKLRDDIAKATGGLPLNGRD